MRPLVLSMAACLFVAGCSPAGPESEPSPTEPRTADPSVPAGDVANVVHVDDGDSIIVAVGGEEVQVRLIGVNAPEQGECLADAARRRLAELIDGRSVVLERDVEDRDRFDRLLRYVWVDAELVNGRMAEEGLVLARAFEPNVTRQESLDAAQSRAQQAERGMWAASACGPGESAEVVIADIQADAPGPDDENLNGEWVSVRNEEETVVDLTGWVLRDETSQNRYTFPDGFRLQPGQEVVVFTGCGTDRSDAVFWCSNRSVWTNGGDTVFVLDRRGGIVDSLAY